jgi:hypothetical protein
MNQTEIEGIAEKCRARIAEPCTGQECIDAIKQALTEALAKSNEQIEKLNNALPIYSIVVVIVVLFLCQRPAC